MAEVEQKHVIKAEDNFDFIALPTGTSASVNRGQVTVNGALILDIVVGDNIMIIEDQFRSGYECKECDGKGKKQIKCLKCDGEGFISSENPADSSTHTCPRCDGKGSREETCKACNGKGALLEIPETARARPTSGTIAAIGPDVKIYKLGDRVAYSGHTGHLLPFKDNNRLRIMREREPFCRLRTVLGQDKVASDIEFIDKDNPYDLQ